MRRRRIGAVPEAGFAREVQCISGKKGLFLKMQDEWGRICFGAKTERERAAEKPVFEFGFAPEKKKN